MSQRLEIYDFNEHPVRTLFNEQGEPWFVAADVCRVLEIANARDAISDLDDDEKNTVAINDGIRGNPNRNIISESGLYVLIFKSRKKEAQDFRRWVTKEVLPSIRKTGRYEAPSAPPPSPAPEALPEIPHVAPLRYVNESWLTRTWSVRKKSRFIDACFLLAEKSRAEPGTDSESGATTLPRWLVVSQAKAEAESTRLALQREAPDMVRFFAAIPREGWLRVEELWKIARKEACFRDLLGTADEFDPVQASVFGKLLTRWLFCARVMPDGRSVMLIRKGSQRHRRYRLEEIEP